MLEASTSFNGVKESELNVLHQSAKMNGTSNRPTLQAHFESDLSSYR